MARASTIAIATGMGVAGTGIAVIPIAATVGIDIAPGRDCTTERREIRRNGRTIIKEMTNCR